MRRRPPCLIDLLDEDYFDIVSLLKDGHTEQKVARRARILLAMSNPETVVQELAEKLELSRNTIRHVSRRYEEVGLESLFAAPRSGRPRELSPPPTRGD